MATTSSPVRRSFCAAFVILSAVSTLAASVALAAEGPGRSSRRIAREEMAKMREARLEAADLEVLVAPLLPWLAGQELQLVVNSRFTEPIDLHVAASSPAGEMDFLTHQRLEPRGTLRLDLDEMLQLFDPGPRDHSLRLSYVGDAEMIQAWLISEGRAGAMEQQMIKVSLQSLTQWHSFWDLDAVAAGRAVVPRFAFQNTEMTPVSIVLRLDDGSGEVESIERVVTAGGTWHFQVDRRMRAGTLSVGHDGSPGQVQAAGVLAGGTFLAQLPLVPHRPDGGPESYESMILSSEDASRRRPIAQLAAIDVVKPSAAEVALLDVDTGLPLASQEVVLRPGHPASLDLSTLLALGVSDREVERFRLRIRSPSRVLAQAFLVGSHGVPTDIALVPASKAHDSGTYPVPNLDRYVAWAEFLNLGEEPAQIFAHLSWAEGDYAVEPFEVPPGGTRMLDISALAESGPPDAAGRSFRPADRPIYFQWMGRRGSSDLIARTFVRRHGETDAIGFNCFGCCEEFPFGAMVPEFAAFLVGTSAQFMAAEYIDTCSGTIGPFYAAPNGVTFNSPLSWNTHEVSAAGQTTQTVSFTGSGMYMQVFCKPRAINYFGDGPTVADEACQQAHNPGFEPSRGCCGMFGLNVSACKSCCDREKSVADCRCDKLPFGFRSLCKALVSLFSTLDCHGPCAAGCGDA